MPHTPLHDDGRVVTLDLHGRSVDDAERLILRVVREAARRGRDRIRLVHGASTSDKRYRNRTIKHAVSAMIEGGALSRWVVQVLPGESATVLALPIGARVDPTRIRWDDIDEPPGDVW